MKSCPYSILNLTTEATLSDIKQQYKLLALKYHPDRLVTASESQQQDGEDTQQLKFIEIQQAYELLRDPKQKRQYDREYHLNKYNLEKQLVGNISDYILLSEMKYDQDEDVCTHQCRCGGLYTIHMNDIINNINENDNDGGIYKSFNINCKNCSLIIQVENDMDDDFEDYED